MVGKQYQPIEKYLLRKAFEGTGLLPDKVLWRPKEAFSDGVSEKGRSLYKIIGEYVDKIITDDEFEMGKKKYSHCPPISKESYYYRKIFEEYLPNRASYITNYWMPRFVECKDPSARVLQN
jgi:asparagine synthase (glutamine-hydrolysing)